MLHVLDWFIWFSLRSVRQRMSLIVCDRLFDRRILIFHWKSIKLSSHPIERNNIDWFTFERIFDWQMFPKEFFFPRNSILSSKISFYFSEDPLTLTDPASIDSVVRLILIQILFSSVDRWTNDQVQTRDNRWFPLILFRCASISIIKIHCREKKKVVPR